MSAKPVTTRPFVIVYVSDLRGDLAPDGPLEIDQDLPASALSKWRPTTAVSIPDPGGAGRWEAQLTIETLQDFDADALLAQFPPAAVRLELLEALTARRKGECDDAAIAAHIRAAVAQDSALVWLNEAVTTSDLGHSGAAAAPPRSPADGGSILDLVDEPDSARSVAENVAQIAGGAATSASHISGASATRWGLAQRRLELELTSALNALLATPALRRIEAAWRSVQFLVERCDLGAGVRLSLLHAPRDLMVSAIAERVIEPAFDGVLPTPGLIICDYAMSNTPPDVVQLAELSRHAASLPAPVTFPLDVSFFNVKSPALIKNLPNLSGVLDTWTYAKWRGLREDAAGRWLLPVFGRCLARPPHARQTVTAAHELMWVSGAVALGVCAARSFAAHGWPTRMFGAEAGKLENLAIVPNPHDAQRPWGPGDTTLPDARLPELFDIGLNVLQSQPGKDYCVLLGGVTLQRPRVSAETPKAQALLEISAPYQQFSSLLAAWLSEQFAVLRGRGEAEIQQHLLFGLRDLLRLTDQDDPDSIMVGVGADPQAPGTTRVQIRVAPPPRIAPGGLHVDFGFVL